jgi:hypothetical protein
MEQAQYRVLERITSKEELQSVLARPAFDNSKAKKEALLKDQLLIRYVGFPREAVPKKSWSCAKEGRTGSWEELKVTLEELLEGEIATPLAWDRLVVPVSALKSAKLPQLGETVTHQRKLLDEALQQKAASSTETSADAAYTPRAAREWEGVGIREPWPRRLTADEQRLERGTEFKDGGKDWVVEGIDYCEEEEWVVYYYEAGKPAPQALGECERSSVGEVLKWAFDIDQPVQPAVAAEATAPVEIAKMKVAELKAELKERGLPEKGLKAELVARLKEAMEEDEAMEEEEEAEETE